MNKINTVVMSLIFALMVSLVASQTALGRSTANPRPPMPKKTPHGYSESGPISSSQIGDTLATIKTNAYLVKQACGLSSTSAELSTCTNDASNSYFISVLAASNIQSLVGMNLAVLVTNHALLLNVQPNSSALPLTGPTTRYAPLGSGPVCEAVVTYLFDVGGGLVLPNTLVGSRYVLTLPQATFPNTATVYSDQPLHPTAGAEVVSYDTASTYSLTVGYSSVGTPCSISSNEVSVTW